jgi:predicted transcriptional regulator
MQLESQGRLLNSARFVEFHSLLYDSLHILDQGASALQQQVKELQDRVAHLMTVIVDNITVKDEEGIEVAVKAVEGIEKDVRPSQVCLVYFDNRQFLSTICYSTLDTIVDKELNEIREQNEWLQGLYADLNMDAVENCLNQPSTAQETFQVHGWIHVVPW